MAPPAQYRVDGAVDTESTRHHHDENADEQVSCGVHLSPCPCMACLCADHVQWLSARSAVRSGVRTSCVALHLGAPDSAGRVDPTVPAASPTRQAFSARGAGDRQITKTKRGEEQRAWSIYPAALGRPVIVSHRRILGCSCLNAECTAISEISLHRGGVAARLTGIESHLL